MLLDVFIILPYLHFIFFNQNKKHAYETRQEDMLHCIANCFGNYFHICSVGT